MPKTQSLISKLKENNKVKYSLIAIGAIVIVAFLWFVFDRKTENLPFKICQGELCIEGKQVGRIEDCVVTEKQERICGPYVLFIDKNVDIKIEQ